ncbi:MAG TPA: AMP-binding protein [Jatrophihabitans sp.]|jgi:2-aminobenzoate-CoA ligase|uniref:AMP-binding protein n=1 Tax=Jatrophihabitans sp. TaxID=1932789 RepID=UPI002DFE7032|nr:AMP-binding protein [Jatrophihabitans sp.]
MTDTFCRDNLPAEDARPDFVFTLPELQYPDRLNAAVELLDATIARLGPDRPALLTPAGETWTYGELSERVDRIARVLVDDLGVVPGNRVVLRAPNNPWLAACWLAVLKAGAVAVTTMPLLRPLEIATLADITRPTVALCDIRFLDDLVAAAVPDLRIVPVGGGTPDDLVQRAAGKPARFDAVDTAADDVALLALTSGTTGRPKATMHYHRDVLAMADTFSAHVVKPTADDVFTGTPPLGFTFGLGGLLVFPLRAGAATLLIERATPAELADIIEQRKVTVCFTAPTAYRAILAAGAAPKLAGVRRAVSAGEHLPEATWHAFRESTGLQIIDGIGSTEMLHVFVSAADDDIRPGATGRAVPGYEVTVLDADGAPAPPGVAGRLAVKGPTGCRYLADPRQAAYVQDGWNITGDTFVRDDDGYFFYRARSDDMIVSSGYNIAGPEVEEALMAHPAVLECCVVGVEDADRGQLVKAFVVPTAGTVADDALVADLQAFTKARIAPYKYPRAIAFVDALPRTSTGKVQRFKLRDAATAG